MKKYCIALLPIENAHLFIALSQLMTAFAKEYQLSEKAMPHITISQFYAKENELETIWHAVSNIVENPNVSLSFSTFSCITFDERTFWISLLPSETADLHKLQKKITAILKTSTQRPYDPHLTLLSTFDKAYEEKAKPLMKKHKTITDNFILSIGVCDEIGQFTDLIYSGR